jgi:chromosome segregation ATPase
MLEKDFELIEHMMSIAVFVREKQYQANKTEELRESLERFEEMMHKVQSRKSKWFDDVDEAKEYAKYRAKSEGEAYTLISLDNQIFVAPNEHVVNQKKIETIWP